jgi:hypothetical protein
MKPGVMAQRMDNAAVFSAQQRERIRAELVAAARADARIDGAAHLGSAALGSGDRWSDIDLALSLVPGADIGRVLVDWTAHMHRDHAAVASCDVRRGDILYRVFLLDNTLQVDLSFWPSGKLRAIGPKFSLIFGAAGEPVAAPVPDVNDLIGMAWLYALHVRSSILRSRLLQAEHMLSGMRDNVLGLMCKRYGVAAVQGRGLDDLPEMPRLRAAESLARSLEPEELKRAYRVTVDILLEEIRFADPARAAKLEHPMSLMVNCLDLE